MSPKPMTNRSSMSSDFMGTVCCSSIPENACQVTGPPPESGSKAVEFKSSKSESSSVGATKTSPARFGSMTRSCPPIVNDRTMWVCGTISSEPLVLTNCPVSARSTTSVCELSSSKRMCFPFLSIRSTFAPSKRSWNSLGRPCLRMTFMALLPGRTSTSLKRRPTTSFSRSRRSTSISGSAGIRPPLVGRTHRFRVGEPLERLPRCVLLRFLLRAPIPNAVEIGVHVDVRGEALVVVRTRGRHPVGREASVIPDDDLLKRGLGVVAAADRDATLDLGLEQWNEDRARLVDPSVQVSRADESLERVGQQRRLLAPAGRFLALAELYVGPDP